MRNAVVLLAIAVLILSACAPQAAPTATVPPPPSETLTPSATPAPTATPTVTPTATPTPIPTLPPQQVGGLEGVPDPRYSNPELFDLSDPNAPIPQFVNAMEMAGIQIAPRQVVDTLRFLSSEDGMHVYALTSNIGSELFDGVSLLMANHSGDSWAWHKTTPSLFWESFGNYEIGTVLEWYRARQDNGYLGYVESDFNHVSLNTEFIWKYLYANGPTPNEYNLTQIDEALKFAGSNSMTVDVEGFTWGIQLPAWIEQANFTKEELIDMLVTHMRLLKRYDGAFKRVNVVSEPFGNPWQANYWTRQLGLETYLQAAFRAARENSPESVLTLVDISPSDKLFTLVKRLNETEQMENGRNLIDAVGFQMPFFLPGSHLSTTDYITYHSRELQFEQFRQMVKMYREMGVDVYVTELLVDLTDVPGSDSDKLLFQAELYRDFLKTCIAENVSVTLYSFYDGPTIYPLGAGRPNAMPYLRDAKYRPKPSYYSLLSISLIP